MTCNNDYCEIEKYPEKRDLDGCYFRVERNGKWENLCFSDMTETERNKVMAEKNILWLAQLCQHLANAIREIGDTFDITGGDE